VFYIAVAPCPVVMIPLKFDGTQTPEEPLLAILKRNWNLRSKASCITKVILMRVV